MMVSPLKEVEVIIPSGVKVLCQSWRKFRLICFTSKVLLFGTIFSRSRNLDIVIKDISYEELKHDCFFRLAMFCAQKPILTLIASLVLVIICGLGIQFATIMTDPIELWSSPTSRSRIEKEYFDQNFGPFYRVEQVIIKPKENSFEEPYFSYK